MAQKNKDNSALEALKAAVGSGRLDNLYIFYGEEKYLLESYLTQIRRHLVSDGFADFNYKRFNAQNFSADALGAACETLPVFAERTLIEVHDYDIFKANEETKQKLFDLIQDLPDYICLIFIYDIINFAPDGRQKLTALLKKTGSIVEFAIQEQSKLIKWIKAHFSKAGKKIDTPTAEYLCFITGGMMTSLNVEIEKISLFTDEEHITRTHIDAVVTPVLDAAVYKLTDYIAGGNYGQASIVLSELFSMREPPQKLIFSISLKLRQLLAARLCLENGLGEKKLMELCAIRYDFQARNLLASARKTSLTVCRQSVTLCAETAVRMNSGGSPEVLLTELIIDLSALRRRSDSC